MALNTRLTVDFQADYNKTNGIAAPAQAIRYRKLYALTTGSAVGKADLVWADQRTLAASANESLDLVGSLTDAFGVTFSPARVKMIVVKAADANTNSVVVGAAAGTQWAALLGSTGTVTLPKGAMFLAAAGVADATAFPCAAAATDLLKVANSGAGTSVTYDIIVVGSST